MVPIYTVSIRTQEKDDHVNIVSIPFHEMEDGP